MPLWDELAGLRVAIDDYSVHRNELVRDGWTRVTTVVAMTGDGATGEGEDVTWQAEAHDDFPDAIMLAGTWSLDDLSRSLGAHDLPDYRRWSFESAALDLGLKQAGRSLSQVTGRPFRPVRFVASIRDVDGWLRQYPALELKLDAAKDWDVDLMQRLDALDRVRVVDLKAYYGNYGDIAPDPVFYRAVVEAFPEAVIEDAWLEDGCLDALQAAEDRLSFDAPVHSLADLDALPVAPRWLNVKPSRFGTVRKLLECVEACEERGIRMYGGGQMELGHGRAQIQKLASIFYADGPNDVAPSSYNEGDARPGLPQSPLPPPDGAGF